MIKVQFFGNFDCQVCLSWDVVDGTALLEVIESLKIFVYFPFTYICTAMNERLKV